MTQKKSTKALSEKESMDLIDTFQSDWDRAWPEERFACVPAVTRIIRLGRIAEQAAEDELSHFDLTRGEAEVMFAVVRNPHMDVTPKVLQGLMLISSAGLTNRLDRLEEKGLIERKLDAEDRRSFVITPTPKGTALALAAYRAHVGREAKLVAALTAQERKTLEALLKKLVLAAEGPVER